MRCGNAELFFQFRASTMRTSRALVAPNQEFKRLLTTLAGVFVNGHVKVSDQLISTAWIDRNTILINLDFLAKHHTMQPVTLNRAQSRNVDHRAINELGMSGLVLMENAGRGVVDKLFQFGIQGPVVICCGKGNNGGDGFVIARHLDLRHQEVRVLLFADPAELTSDALANYRLLQHCDIPMQVFSPQATGDEIAAALPKRGWIVDALLGTGATGNPRAPIDQALLAMNAASARKLAVDLPSGLDCDTGQPGEPTFRAEHTCTFVAPKTGFYAAGAEAYTGVVHVIDIGAPRTLIEEILAASRA